MFQKATQEGQKKGVGAVATNTALLLCARRGELDKDKIAEGLLRIVADADAGNPVALRLQVLVGLGVARPGERRARAEREAQGVGANRQHCGCVCMQETREREREEEVAF